MTPTTLWTWPRTQKEFTAGRHEAFTNSRIISSTDHDFHSYSMGRSCKIVAPVGAITFIWHAEPIGLQVSAKGISSRTQSWDVHCAQGFKREPQDLKYTLCASHLLYKCAAKILSAKKRWQTVVTFRGSITGFATERFSFATEGMILIHKFQSRSTWSST